VGVCRDSMSLGTHDVSWKYVVRPTYGVVGLCRDSQIICREHMS
jgi:hypothetical protein